MSKKRKRKSKSSSIGADSDDGSFDIDGDLTQSPKKKILRSPAKMDIALKKSSNQNEESSSDENEYDSTDHSREQSLIATLNHSVNRESKFEIRKHAFQRLKNADKENSDPSDSSSNSSHFKKKRKIMDDSDDDGYDEFLISEKQSSPAYKCLNGDYDGNGLKSFYKNTLGIESETDSDLQSSSNLDIEMIKPPKKKRKLNDENKSFGGLPISEDIIGKIGRFFPLTFVSTTLVLINLDFCAYFNSDKFWKPFYSLFSKTLMSEAEKREFKQYKMNKNSKLYKRRMLWYYITVPMTTHIPVVDSDFDAMLKKYIPSLIDYVHENNDADVLQASYLVNKIEKHHRYYMNRKFCIKLYLVKEMIVMHYYKKHNKMKQKNDNNAIDLIYRYRAEEMNFIMPKKGRQQIGMYRSQFYAVCEEKYLPKERFDALYESFMAEWKSPHDIVERFRLVNQLFVEYKLSKIVKNNVLDLEFVAKIQRFYENASENANNVIKQLCNDANPIHHCIDFDDEQGDTMIVTIKSPKAVLHQQIKYVMEFINTFDDKRRLRCTLDELYNELTIRKVICSEQEFENMKALIDRSQFKFTNDSITLLTMVKPSLKHRKVNVLKLLTSQGLMNEVDATNLIRQGRVKVHNKIRWDPKFGLTLQPGTPFTIDKHKFYYYPFLYLLYNKPQHVVCSLDSSNSVDSFPICFLNRPKPLKPVLSLPSNMSGLTIYSDDAALISHVQKKRDLINKHVFEVQFVHRRDNMEICEEDNLHYTDWNELNSLQFMQRLYDGVDVHATKNKNAFTKVNIEEAICVDEDYRNENIRYAHVRISKWSITMSKYPKSLYRLLRSVELSPYYIHRISIGDNIHLDECPVNEWRMMNEKEIGDLARFNECSPYTTQIDADSVMTFQNNSNIDKLFKAVAPSEIEHFSFQ